MKNTSTSILDSDAADFEAAYGESLINTLDLNTWSEGENLADTFGRVEREVAEAIEKEDEYRRQIRKIIFPKLATAPGAPDGAGLHKATIPELEKVQRGLLFNGAVEAADGTSVVHDTIPLTITQIGVSLVSYNGQQGTWVNKLFRRDLRSKISDPVEEVLSVLDRREKREGQGQEGNSLSELARRGIMAYAERAILKEKSQAQWRMGHGSPAPYELLTGLWSSQGDRIRLSLDLIKWYVLEHKRFVFIPSAPRKRHWLMIGNALRPLEFAIIQTLKPEIEKLIENGGYREESGVLREMKKFRDEVAPQIVVGLYRASAMSPPYLFYAHKDYAQVAARIALADSILQEHRGFPMLIDLADTVCSATFGVDSFMSSVQTAYADAGQPHRYFAERETRTK
ncbi:MAG: hypothetical protein LUM44_09455 [Pyrinomonadaceae bacterium]|nr:hypothetical protein [Pyrinomonadaceae bacterium]